MNNKLIKFNADARDSMLKGMEILAEAVGSTLGPKGKCVVIDDYQDGKPLVTKDGVTVARNIQLKDKFQNIGVQLLREASTKTVESVGDGTTTSCVLAFKMISEINKLIKNGKNPIQIKNEIKEIYEDIIKALKDQAIPVIDEDISKVATISANNDEEIGKLIAEAFQKIGRDGVITVEESSSIQTYIDVINGMQFDRGYESPYFATDPIKGNCVLEKPYILITDRKIQLMKELVPLLEIVNQKNRPILIIAQDYDNEVIQNLKINKTRGILQVCAIKAPSYGEYRNKLLEDLAILTGGKVITYESGVNLQKCDETILGSCEKVVITRDNTTLINGSGSKELIDARCQQIKSELDNPSDTLDSEFLREFNNLRIARLSGGVAVIHVGGTTELEMKERKDRIDDAVCATKAAIEEGIVPGGGVSFIIAADSIVKNKTNFTDAQRIILDCMFCIQDKIISNCGLDLQSILQDLPVNYGFDANKMEWVDVLKSGIINPAKSDRLAFENAFSVLNLYLSANTLVINEELVF